MECKHCKGKVEEEFQFCPCCGEKIEHEVVVEEVKELPKEDVKEEIKEQSKNKIHFGTLLFSIMFIFSLLAIALVLNLEQEVNIMKHEIYTLYQKNVSDDAKEHAKEKAKESAITGGKVNVTHISRFSDGDKHMFAFNIDVPDNILFKGVAVADLPKDERQAFANELIELGWARVSENAVACYPNVEIQLLVNEKPYAAYDGKKISVYQQK